MNMLVVLPVVIPLVTALFGLVALNYTRVQQWISHVGSILLLFVSLLLLQTVWNQGILVVQLGNWQAPFGISFVADLLSALMVVISGLVAVVISLYASALEDSRYLKFGMFPLIHLLIAGVSGAFLTGDFFNLFVWFEVMLMASFVLMVLGNCNSQVEGGFKYVTINIIASVLFLAALGILYGKVGSLNMADIGLKLMQKENSDVALTAGILLMIAFGLKAGLFPLFFWLPASYHTPPPVISALFTGLLTKVGVYALIRSFTLVFTQDLSYTHTILLVVSGLTMVSGVLGAASQFHIRKILSFHTISQIGYMTLGLALFTASALSAAVFYMFHHFLVKTNLFLISGFIHRNEGTEQLKKLGGLYRRAPWLSILFLISALSLVGIPPLSGFFAKFAMIKASLEVDQYLIAAVVPAVGVLTLYSMTKIWAEAFWKKEPVKEAETKSESKSVFMLVPIVIMAVLTVGVGLFPQVLFEITDGAAKQLLNSEVYIHAVLGENYVARYSVF